MIERTFDAAWFNELCNRPEVRPGLGGQGPIDVAALIENPANYALRTKHGGFMLINYGAGFYGVHTQFAAEGRGRHAIEAMLAGLDYMFCRTDCMRIHSHCPDNNPAALALAKAGGARLWFRREIEPQLGPGQTVSWDVFDWPNDTPGLEAEGREFHEVCEAAMQDLGLPEHPHDAVHDRYVGAAVRMCRNGHARKGIALYNQYAAAAGYTPVTLLNDSPTVVDCGEPGVLDMALALNGDNMEVVRCRSG